jgi:hypothetical protein
LKRSKQHKPDQRKAEILPEAEQEESKPILQDGKIVPTMFAKKANIVKHIKHNL